MTVRPFVGASTITVVASTDNGRMVFQGGNGTITVTLPVDWSRVIPPFSVVATTVVVDAPTNGLTVIVPV